MSLQIPFMPFVAYSISVIKFINKDAMVDGVVLTNGHN